MDIHTSLSTVQKHELEWGIQETHNKTFTTIIVTVTAQTPVIIKKEGSSLIPFVRLEDNAISVKLLLVQYLTR
jgi:hypothetical protein